MAKYLAASPVSADMRGLLPVYIMMGENEVMLNIGTMLAERLAEQWARPGMFLV